MEGRKCNNNNNRVETTGSSGLCQHPDPNYLYFEGSVLHNNNPDIFNFGCLIYNLYPCAIRETKKRLQYKTDGLVLLPVSI